MIKLRKGVWWRPDFAPYLVRWLLVIPTVRKLEYPSRGLGMRLWIYTRWKSTCFDVLYYYERENDMWFFTFWCMAWGCFPALLAGFQ